ncbi:hypothetical protein L484_010730 [Morus notabilis]|uniref:DUF761 domain-containing protein n=1 Tax=Morus notabilis TaxID=981085 RepID=W9RR77_9ROSA|nr:uncharacterized protein LOC21394018 [Morus notabilis]EXB93402.1 hypothetical protein L484_010730 [Morus notabilis]
MVEVEVVLEQCPSPPPLISKKLSNAVRLIIFMIQKRSRKLAMPDLQVMVRRGKILGKSFNDLMLRHNTALGCTSHDVRMSFVSPREYEFSCSSSPPHRRYSSCHVTKRKHDNNYYNNYMKHSRRGHGHGHGHGNRIIPQPPPAFDEDDVVLPVGSFKMFNRRTTEVESPLRTPVSGSSSRWIKTTTKESSSFRSGGSCCADEEEEEFHVDKAAEEFIEKFYRELMMQKWTAREPSDRFA